MYKLREAVGYDMDLMIDGMGSGNHTQQDIINVLCPAWEELKFLWVENSIPGGRREP